MIAKELFERLFPTKNLNPRKFNLVRKRDELIAALNKFLPEYEINTYLRLCAFLSCCGVETDYFRTTEEYASGEAYEGRRDLGNTQEGDGRRFKGSSLIQTTGRFNFFRVLARFIKKLTGKDYSKDQAKALAEADRLGVNFLRHPELLRDNIEIAVEAACIFWEENNLNKYADAGEIKQLNGIVNRGDKNKLALHWDKRNELYSLCKRRVPTDFSFAPAQILPLAVTADSQPVVLTPADDSEPAVQPAADSAPTGADKSKVREFSEKYLKHCPQDTAKNVAAIVLARAGGSITTVWTLGLHGQILLIVAALLVLGFSGYAVFKYSSRIIGWAKDLADPFTGDAEA